MGIIKSLLENDVYKWNMSYAIMKTYPFAETVFEFKNRKDEKFNEDFVDEFKLEVSKLCTLRLKPEEKSFLLNKFYWIPKYFFDWFEGFKFDDSKLEVWLNNLSQLFAKSADGFRWDSGSWESFTTKIIDRLVELRVNPLTKTLIYSDSIDMKRFLDIYRNVKGRVGRVAAGIGGSLTNNTGLDGASPQVVMKLTKARINSTSSWINCVKCPDTKGKYMGDMKEVELCLRSIGREDELSNIKL